MNEGFILSNKIRKAVFVEIASGEKRLERIAKKQHLIERAVKNAAEELQKHGIIEEGEDGYKLTDEGIKLYAKMKGREEL
ncbi:MAG: hypothetical protein FE044_01635 [Thermoplasmata archaeon]|nr:MAG: hypothetical protein FE044_01635 [Thermoplasmata archaeon]KAA0007747.1 MAG: hypothetical protein FE036_03125 [Thermoplasmata archaeon]MCD6572637.1 hypothetical protein [Thermoplasmata archaeon]